MIGMILAAALSNVAPRAMLGRWDFGKDGEGADTCVLTLRPDLVIGGWGLTVAKDCAKATPLWDDLYAWRMTPDGDLVLADPTRKGVVTLHPYEKGVFSTPIGAPQAYLLIRRTGR